jgi:hypothetical protein
MSRLRMLALLAFPMLTGCAPAACLCPYAAATVNIRVRDAAGSAVADPRFLEDMRALAAYCVDDPADAQSPCREWRIDDLPGRHVLTVTAMGFAAQQVVVDTERAGCCGYDPVLTTVVLTTG